MNENIYYEGFDYRAQELSAYIFTIDTFIISLRNGVIVRHSPRDVEGFAMWLRVHGVRDISEDNGWQRVGG